MKYGHYGFLVEVGLKYAPVFDDEFPKFLYGRFRPPIDLLQGR